MMMAHTRKPRLYCTADRPDFRFDPPEDEFRRGVLANVAASCEEEIDHAPPERVPQLDSSPYPYHNLYLCFYNALQGQSMVTQFSFGYLLTGDERYAEQAARWVRAMCGWNYTINTFYSSARVMHALAVAEDWLGDRLAPDDLERMHGYNAGLCRFHEQAIDDIRGTPDADAHGTLYTAHFGIAALSLLGSEPEAEKWLDWVIAKFRNALLPRGVAPDGSYHDGNWALGYTLFSKFLFMDALKNVTGIDLYQDHLEDCVRALQFINRAYVGGERVEAKRTYGGDENLLTGSWQLDNFTPVILKMAALAGDPYAQWIGTRDPNAGKIQRTESAVKGGAECMFAWGPFAYLWYDPNLAARGTPDFPASGSYPGSEYAILRSRWESPALVAGYQGRNDMGSYYSSNLVLHWDGRPMTKAAPAPESVPFCEGNAPAMAGEMELIGQTDAFRQTDAGGYLRARGFLTTQEIGVFREPEPCAVIRVAARRRTKTEARFAESDGGRYLRLGRGGYLQYAREGNFSPEAGALRVVFRFRRGVKVKGRPRVLVGIGPSLLGMSGNNFHLWLTEGGRLAFRVCDHQNRPILADAELPGSGSGWHEAVAWWSGLNGTGGPAAAGLLLDGNEVTARADLPAGEPFITHPNTSIWLGGSVQTPHTDAQADVRSFEIWGAGTSEAPPLFRADYTAGQTDAEIAGGNAAECAEKPLELRWHPYRQAAITDYGAELIHDHARLAVVSLSPGGLDFTLEEIPYAQSGFAGGSFVEKPERYTRLTIRPLGEGSEIMLGVVPSGLLEDPALLARLAEMLESIAGG